VESYVEKLKSEPMPVQLFWRVQYPEVQPQPSSETFLWKTLDNSF